MYSLPVPEAVAVVPVAEEVAVSTVDLIAGDMKNPTPDQLRCLYNRLTKSSATWNREKFERYVKGGEFGDGYPHLLSLIGIETDAHTCCKSVRV